MPTSSPKRTFLEEARRAQIIEATVEVLAAHGYMKASFAQIAKQAGISTSLIPYHFKNKEELTASVFSAITSNRDAYVRERIQAANTARERLEIAVEADLTYMGTRPKQFLAMVEILFGARSNKGTLAHLGAPDDIGAITLASILKEGQQTGEFGSFDVDHVALVIGGAKDTFLAQLPLRPGADLEAFTQSLITIVRQITRT